MAKKIIIGNWKMNPRTEKEAQSWFKKISGLIKNVKNTEIVVCAPFIYLINLKKMSRKIIFGAQNSFLGDVGAFTGEISTDMLHEAGVRYVILGHSERRTLGETNELINKKIKSALAFGVRPVLCVGESVRDENHNYFNLIKTQLEECLNGISKDSVSKIIIAYEPVWAISSTVNRSDVTPEILHEMVIFIRKILSDKFGKEISKIKIVYGGSVNEKDARDFLFMGEVDGLLSGKASLNPEKFSEIIKIAENL